MIAGDVPLEDLVGALVVFRRGLVPEYGLVQGGNPTGSSLFVRYGSGDTAQATLRSDLDLVVPAVRNADRELLIDLRQRLDEAKRQTLAVRAALDLRTAQMESEDDVPIGDMLDAVYTLQDAAAALVEIITRP